MPKYFRTICKQCTKPYVGRGRYFCSNSCRVTWTNLHRNVSKRLDVRQKISLSRKGRATCKGEKHWNWQGKSNPRYCIDCRRPIKTPAWGGRIIKYCGFCKQKGERSPNWKGGTTPARVKEFQTTAYKNFVSAVLIKDNYTCQDCGAKNGNGTTVKLQIHHIKPYAEYPGLRFTVNNGITLCKLCHDRTKRGRPRPRTVTTICS